MSDPLLSDWIVRSFVGAAMAIVAGIGVAAIRKHNAGAKSQEAEARGDVAEAEAGASLYKHYVDEVAELRREVRAMANRLAVAEAKHAEFEQKYKASAAGEKRYRSGFAEMLHIYTDLVGVSRPLVSPDEMKRIDGRVTVLIMQLAMPLNLDENDND